MASVTEHAGPEYLTSEDIAEFLGVPEWCVLKVLAASRLDPWDGRYRVGDYAAEVRRLALWDRTPRPHLYEALQMQWQLWAKKPKPRGRYTRK